MFVLAILGILASAHEVEEAGDIGIDLLFMGVATALGGELAVSDGVVDAGLIAEVVAELALVALGTVVLVV